MYSTTLLIIGVGGAALYWLYSKKQQTERNNVLTPKFDTPLQKHKLGGMLKNKIPNRIPNSKLFGNINDTYIQTV